MKFRKFNPQYYNRHFIGELFEQGYVPEAGFVDKNNIGLLESN